MCFTVFTAVDLLGVQVDVVGETHQVLWRPTPRPRRSRPELLGVR